jgi:excinuclease UvrABC nuclease subunit
MSREELEPLDWSQWLDFDKRNIIAVPELPGVYKMHESMKILYIGSSQNLREALLDCLSDPCISKSKRFNYAITQLEVGKLKEQLINNYRSKHNDKLPTCMEEK